VKLGEVCSKPQYGWTTKAKQEGGGLKLVRTTDITSGQINWSTVPFCTESPADVETYLVQEGDILISRAGSVGVSHLVTSTQPAVFASYLIRFKPGPDVLPKYLAYFLQSPSYWKQIASSTAGIAVPNVNASKLNEVELPLAPADEQRRIVAEIEKQFSRLDESLANLKRVNANIRRYKAAVLQSAVDGRILGEVFSDTEFPGDWGWGTCGDVIESIQAGSSFKCVERPPTVGEVGVVKVSAVTWGEFDENESKTCLNPERVREALFIKPGDFLFSRANTIELVGACVIAKTVTKSLMLSDKILRFRLAPGLEPRWLLICLQSRFGRAEIERLATGNQESMRNIGQDRIRKIRLPLPTVAAQRRIVAEVERRFSIIRGAEVQVDAGLRRAQALQRAVLSEVYERGYSGLGRA